MINCVHIEHQSDIPNAEYDRLIMIENKQKNKRHLFLLYYRMLTMSGKVDVLNSMINESLL
jgi:hypothetical protein